jgi:hypothetical protein
LWIETCVFSYSEWQFQKSSVKVKIVVIKSGNELNNQLKLILIVSTFTVFYFLFFCSLVPVQAGFKSWTDLILKKLAKGARHKEIRKFELLFPNFDQFGLNYTFYLVNWRSEVYQSCQDLKKCLNMSNEDMAGSETKFEQQIETSSSRKSSDGRQNDW